MIFKHKLFKVDLALILLTFLGLLYLYSNQKVSLIYALTILIIYISSKIIGYILLPYNLFDIFINNLTKSSKVSILSGFEVFKTSLVILLFLGFIFIDPAIWIIESILVVMMRIWGIAFIKNNGISK